MKNIKIDFIDKVILIILGFSPKKISKWLKSKGVLNSKRDEEVAEEWEKIGVEIRRINKYLRPRSRRQIKRIVKGEKFKKVVKDLGKLSLKLKKLKKERYKGSVFFDSFFKFVLFTIWFEFTFFASFGIKNIRHEREHAKVYLKKGIKCRYGWQKVFDIKKKEYMFHPFVSVSAPIKIHLQSLKYVKKPSQGDLFHLNLIKKYYVN
ncbi:MAG: hypothetical protein ABIH59_00625 [archaeon]